MSQILGYGYSSGAFTLSSYVDLLGGDQIDRVVMADFFLSDSAVVDDKILQEVWKSPISHFRTEYGVYSEFSWVAISAHVSSLSDIPGFCLLLPEFSRSGQAIFLLVINDTEGGDWLFTNDSQVAERILSMGFRLFGELTEENTKSFIPMAGVDSSALRRYVKF